MEEIDLKRCPRCSNILKLRPISPTFDPEGSRFGFRLVCTNCGWYDADRFFDKNFEVLDER